MTQPTVLVTGGAGFIGSHLVEALLADNFLVRVLDNLSTGKRENLPHHPNVELIVGDVADPNVVQRATQHCQAVAHLAAVASVQASVDDPIGTHQSNLVATIQLCEAMRAANVSRIVFASSAAVYGNHGEGQAVDEDTPKAPLTPYAADKLASEYYLDFYRRQHGLDPVIFRFFNIYGPRQDRQHGLDPVISIFTERAQKGLPITVFGDGHQTRDFVFVQDLVAVLMQALKAPRATHQPMNVGWNQATSLNQLLQIIQRVLGHLPTVDYTTPRPGDIRHSRANNERLLTHYRLPTPATDMHEGLRRLLGK